MARQKRSRKRKHKVFGKLHVYTEGELARHASIVRRRRKELGLGENDFVPLPKDKEVSLAT